MVFSWISLRYIAKSTIFNLFAIISSESIDGLFTLSIWDSDSVMACLFLFLFLFLIQISELRSQTCCECFGFLNISLNLQYLSWNPWQSSDFYIIFKDFIHKYCEFHIFLWLEFFLLYSFHHLLACFIFYPYLQVYSRILGMCYNFTNQDFVVFPVSATTSLIFCEIMYIQPSLLNSWFITRWVYKGMDCKYTFRVVVHLALCGNHKGWELTCQ